MAHYVFIESRDPFEFRDAQFLADTATALKKAGNNVTVFLVQNAVLGARKAARGSHIPQLAAAHISLLADSFSMRERGIRSEECSAGIQESNIENLVDLVVQENVKAIWH